MSSKPYRSVAAKPVSRQERQMVDELREAIKELPLAELAKLRREGLNGEPLHRALGFNSEREEREYLVGTVEQKQASSRQPREMKSLFEARVKPKKPSKKDDQWTVEASETDEPYLPAKAKSQQASSFPQRSSTKVPKGEDSGSDGVQERRSNARETPDDEEFASDSDDDSDDDEEPSEDEGDEQALKRKLRRRKRAAPLEKPSKMQVSRNKQVVPLTSASIKPGKDPRFTKQQLDSNLHRARFGFLEDLRDEEIDEKRKIVQRELMARQLKASRRGRRLKKLTDEELAEARADLTRLEQHRAETNRAKAYQERLSELKRKERDLVEKGVKQPFHMSQKAKKDLQKEIKFEDFEKRHKLERYMQKKRKLDEGKSRREDSKGPRLGM